MVIGQEQEGAPGKRIALYGLAMAETVTTEPAAATPGVAADRDAVAHSLLAIHDWPRDPVWGDIEVTKLELQVIDTEDFQRLRRVKQLGPTDWVYPGAKHDRFTHSLGTLYWTQKIIDTCNKNAGSYDGVSVSEYPRFLARMSALLHDLAHIPYGHTLEDEGSLWPSQWNDASRSAALLGPGKPIGEIISRAFLSLGKDASTRVVTDISDVLLAKERTKGEADSDGAVDEVEHDITKLPFPYVADIVGNTICADLLDYIARDFLHTGIREQYGDRFLRYFVVKSEKSGAPARLTIAALGRDGRPRASVVSEAVDVLRRRLSLAEKVYYHRTKIAASAMIISAVANSRFFRSDYLSPGTAPVLTPDGACQLLKFGDDELVGLLCEAVQVSSVAAARTGTGSDTSNPQPPGNPRCQRIMEHWKSRHLYKPVYRTSYWPGRLISREKANALIETYTRPQARLEAERRIERAFSVTEGDVIVYCPPRKMGMKVYRARLLLNEGRIVTLEGSLEENQGYPDENVQGEIKSIKDRHLSLWGLHVFISPTALNQVDKTDLSDFCTDLFGFPNDLDQIVVPGARSLRIIVRSHARRFSREHSEQPVTEPELTKLEALVAGRYRGSERDEGITYEKICEDIGILRAGKTGKLGS